MQTTIHGVFLDILNMGVLLIGDSGIGKSEVALGLIYNGHRLIADDIVQFTLSTQRQMVLGSSPDLLQDFIEVRGLGMLDVRALFGDRAICERQHLDLVIKLMAMNVDNLIDIDRLQGIEQRYHVLDREFPEVTIPVIPGRNLAVLVECAARNQQQKQNGYDASLAFIRRHQESMTHELLEH